VARRSGWRATTTCTSVRSRNGSLEGDSNPDGWPFQTRHRNSLHRDHFRENVILPALRAAGLPEAIRTYDLRHSHASLLIDLCANPLAVAQRMGHSDAAFTLRVYGHLLDGVQAKLSEQLDALRVRTARSASPGKVVDLPLPQARARAR
jgi:integrase